MMHVIILYNSEKNILQLLSEIPKNRPIKGKHKLNSKLISFLRLSVWCSLEFVGKNRETIKLFNIKLKIPSLISRRLVLFMPGGENVTKIGTQ